jgi:dimethylhistidine N-methyltransferase
MNIEFASDVIKGLTSTKKHLSSKYFYDNTGSCIFQEIMEMPEYYLTASEFEILSSQAKQIIEAINFKKPFNIVELGAGDGLKTFKLLEYLVNNNIDFYYVPIDISQGAMDSLTKSLKRKLPKLSIYPQVGDYFEILSKENVKTNIPSLLLFLGSNIGNYDKYEALKLLQLFNKSMKDGDGLLLGVDIKKNPKKIHEAYYDKHGITKRFNINLLVRINNEFDADFNIENFDFYCFYNPISGNVKSYIISLEDQNVHLKKLDKTINFKADELIWTELSKKYSLNEINKLADKCNFKVIDHFLDKKKYFTDTLLIK